MIEAKNYLTAITTGGFLPNEVEELQNRVRTNQAQGGLMYGDVAARQEAQTIGQIGAQRRLGAAQQLSELTQMEAMLPSEIAALESGAEAALMGAATQQLSSPLYALGSLYGGASSGLGEIFGMFGGY